MNLLQKFAGWVDDLVPYSLRILGWRSRYATTPLGPLHYFEVEGTGTGPPFLLIHGIASRAADYALLVRRLRPLTRRIVVADLPGHGFSRFEAPTAEDLRTILTAAIDQLLPEKGIVLGNSLGGLIATRLALTVPERVHALILLSPAGAQVDATQIATIRGHFTIASHKDALSFVDKLIGLPSKFRWFLAIGLPSRLQKPAVRTLLSRFSNEDMLTPEQVRSLPMPVFFFWGADDKILDVAQRDWYLSALPPHAVVETPSRYGHSPFMNNPREFVARLADFLEHLGFPNEISDVIP